MILKGPTDFGSWTEHPTGSGEFYFLAYPLLGVSSGMDLRKG